MLWKCQDKNAFYLILFGAGSLRGGSEITLRTVVNAEKVLIWQIKYARRSVLLIGFPYKSENRFRATGQKQTVPRDTPEHPKSL